MNRGLALIACISTGWLALVSAAHAETAHLELKELSKSRDYGSAEYYLGMTSPQSFARHDGMPENTEEPKFESIIKKEPKYTFDRPFKGVIKFGAYEYGFACDSTKFKSKGYDRVYVDLNRNGDLTDDTVLKGNTQPGVIFGGNYRYYDLPSQRLKAEAGGKTFECPFEFLIGCNFDDDGKVLYVYLSVKNNSYRQGKITIDGKEHGIILLDYNSNGTFNDVFKNDESVKMADGQLYPGTGDMVLVDADTKTPRYSGYSPVDSPDRQYLSKLVNIEGKYYEISATPSGDEVTINPAKVPLGAVTNANGPYRAVLFNKDAMIKITGEKDKPVAVPAGEWRLLEYQIDVTDAPARKPESKPAETAPADKPAEKKKGLGQRLASLFGADDSSGASAGIFDRGPKFTLVKARATDKGKPIKVAEGKTEALPFGPPYKPVVSVSYFNEKDREARLGLKLVGVAGEICESLTIKGQSPSQPTFRILDKDGALVKKGQFEYG